MTTFLRPAILGGVDGVITSFAIVAGVHAGELGVRAVVLMGTSSVAADGLSMGVSEYLSTVSTDGRRRAGIQGVLCFASFVLNGAIPIFFYAVVSSRLLAVAMFSLVQLMLLGCVRSRLAGENILVGLSQTSILGAAAGAVAFGVGNAIHGLS